MKLPKNVSTKSAVLVLLFAVIGTVSITQSLAEPKDDKVTDVGSASIAEAADVVTLYTSPSEISSSQGQEFTVSLKVNSAGTSVNGVDAALVYETDEVEFVRIDAKDGSFDISAEESGDDGVVSIARGSTQPASGDLFIADVIFRSVNNSGTASINVRDDSVVVDAQEFIDVLQQVSGSSVVFDR